MVEQQDRLGAGRGRGRMAGEEGGGRGREGRLQSVLGVPLVGSDHPSGF